MICPDCGAGAGEHHTAGCPMVRDHRPNLPAPMSLTDALRAIRDLADVMAHEEPDRWGAIDRLHEIWDIANGSIGQVEAALANVPRFDPTLTLRRVECVEDDPAILAKPPPADPRLIKYVMIGEASLPWESPFWRKRRRRA